MSLADQIAQWLYEHLAAAGAQGFVVGLSGGVDSATSAALAVRAVGAERVLGALLPCHSQPEDACLGRLVAETFGIPTVTADLGSAYDTLMASLPPSEVAMAAANIKPRLRMIALYYLAQSRGYLVLGSGNKSEIMVGYTTKWGDNAADLLPLGALYKTQVWELARELGVPRQVIERVPTAGLWPGQTDEGEMGITYAELDRTLAAIEAGDTSAIDPATLAKVQEMVARSAHKRTMLPVFQPTNRSADRPISQSANQRAVLEAASPLIEMALTEDIGPGDVTSEAILPRGEVARARIVAKKAGVIAGLPVAHAVFMRVEPRLRFEARACDGDPVAPGDVIAEVEGPVRGMLAAERTVLNFLQHLSGIATLTRAFVDEVAGSNAVILDTRKTHPGYRALEKYAVRMGGGQNHRFGLHDMVLIKDNHIAAAGSITAAVERARAARPELQIEVEVTNLDQLREALVLKPDRIMLDNMSLAQMREAVQVADGRVPLEVSGGVTLETAAAVAATGVDYISIGALTHSAPALDISMDIESADQQISGSRNTDHRARITEIKRALGSALVILGHHYQADKVIEYADLRGDSLKLAREAAGCRDARYIVFCGVHFMAETAAVLAQPGQVVLLPDVEAGCPLAEMASLADVQRAWAELGEMMDVEREVMPVTYINSTADLKAFCGEHGGLVCTSSNAAGALKWALERRLRALFFPDQHLGRNTAKRMGIPLDEMLLWNPSRPYGGNDKEGLHKARVLLWRGWCNVHQRFRPEHVTYWREREPGIRILVHPECMMEVVDLADEFGSTEAIIRRVEAAEPGSKWAIGTEGNLVNRLAREHPEQFIVSLSPEPSYCRTMARIRPENLLRVLEGLERGQLINQITVPDEIARPARVALERMLEVKM